MRWLLLLLPCISAVLLLRWLIHSASERTVSDAWLADHDRRACGVGIDQTGVQSWPIEKMP